MKITKEIHPLWKEWDKMPQELKNHLFTKKSILGKWHYHYENKNGIIGLVRLNHSMNLLKEGHCWEACGVLEYQRFFTKKEAEKIIYEALHESN